MTISRLLALGLLLLAGAATGQEPSAYYASAGERVDNFEHQGFNYRLDLAGEGYTFVDFSKRVPEASFAAVRFHPNTFALVIAEDLGSGLTAEDYAELVQREMRGQLDDEEGEFKGATDIGRREVRGMDVFQKTIHAEIGAAPVTYVLSTIVDGSRAYQLLAFGSYESDDVVRAEADRLLQAFSIIDPVPGRELAATAASVEDYRSETFAYRFRARGDGWFGWNNLAETNDGADFGALSARGYGAVVMPMCWQSRRPTENALYRVVMQQFGEDYPSDFISEERDIRKGDASGKLFIGTEENEGQLYIYYQWVVANDDCAYTLAAWGPAEGNNVEKDLQRLWRDFEITGEPGATEGRYRDQHEREANAYLVNALGLHYYEARSFRDAFEYFAQANELSPADEAYIVNAVRSLVEIDAYHEAATWITARMGLFADNQLVQSWDAWLAYQTDDPEKALRIYDALFDTDYRDDDDFSAYMTMLADAGRWNDLEREFDAYTAVEFSESTHRLHVQLLVRRERYEEALAILDQLTTGRPFNADLVYERMSILDQMGNPAEVLRLSQSLIDNGYRSLQSYYYKGDAEYQLRSYREARESFEQALAFAPANANIKEYLDAIDHMLGEGDTTTIATPIDAVKLPKPLQKIFDATDLDASAESYGATFLSRITGFEFDGGDVLRQSQYRKIRVLDDNGVMQFSTLEFDFDPAFEQLFVNQLRVRDENGELIAEGDLNTYYITNSETGYEASTEKTVHLPVPSLHRGMVIEVVVTKRTSVEDGTFPLETVYLSTDRPVSYSAVFVTGDHDRLEYQLSGVDAPRKSGKALIWSKENPPPFRWEPLQPFYDQILPWVQLGTVNASWAEAGSEYLARIDDKLDVSEVGDRAAQLVEGVDGVDRKIEILSAFVQNEIRYEAIEFGRRAYIPKTARETLRDRYGDCKDHAVLLYSMLRSVGIDASLALVNLNQQVVPGLPNTDQFDHMIVAAMNEGERVFIDATDKDLRLGNLPPRSMAGNYALQLGEKPDLIRIPDYESALTGIDVERVVASRDDGSIDVTETARFTGYQAAELRGQLRNIESSEMQASLQRWVTTRYPDAELTEYFVDNIFDAGYDLLVEIRYTLPVEADGSFDVPSFLETYYLEYERVADRRFPFEYFFPLRVRAITSVRAPQGQRLTEAAKKPDAGESKFGSWRRQVSRDNGNWQVRFDFVASEERFGPEDYRAFSEFQRQAIDAIEQPLLVE
jgi:transglutaminase-like putative cysteine protease/tetratricopeptide (TPR) repeat protein